MSDLWRFVRLAVPRLPWFAAGLGLAILALGSAIGLLALSGWFITASALAGLGLIIGLDVFGPAGGIRAFAVTRTLARYGERLVNHEAVLRHLADLRTWLFERLTPLDPGTLARYRSADLLQRLVGDIDTLDGLFLRVITPTLTGFLVLLAGAVFLGWLAPPTVIWILVPLLVAGTLLPALAMQLGRKAGQERTRAAAEVRERTVEGLQGLAELRTYGACERQRARLAAAERERAGAELRLVRWGALGDAAALLAGLGAVWLALWLGVGWLATGQASAPLVVLVVLAVFGLSEAVGLLPGAYQRVGQMRRAAQRLREVAETRPALPEPAVASAPGATPDLHFEQVRLRYRADGPLVLDGIDLAIPPGETVLITGRSGAGKTSLAAVALRLVAPETGEARVGGVPVAQLRYHDLYAQVGALTQETTLFADSLAENLRLVHPDATDAALRAALFTAGLDDFVATLADGLDTRVGEGGAKLSGGQARRLALARVILRDPPLVILDEPFRGLDHDTIARLRERLAPWLATRAALIIAHDTSTAPPATRHYRLRAGRLVEVAPSRDGPPPTAARSIATGSPPPTG